MRLLDDTKVWHDGLEGWKQISEINELSAFAIKRPPSLNAGHIVETPNSNYKTEVSGHLKVTTEKVPSPTLEAIKPTRSTLTWLIVWCSFHLFALLMAYSQIDIFNKDKSNTDKFWPFVSFTYDTVSEKGWSMKVGESMPLDEYYDRNGGFYGIFAEYDWTEFALYVGGAIVIYLLVSISGKKLDNLNVTKANETEKNDTTSIKFYGTHPLIDGKTLQFLSEASLNGKDKVLIDGQIPEDGYYYSSRSNKIYDIEDSIVVDEYLSERFEIKGVGVLEIYSNYQTTSRKNAPAFINDNPAPDDIYKTGMFSKITVKNGIVV